ncbi:helix-turn-helix transcriptional regulator [Aerococcus urinae]|uniref:helix-turn-helix domain-containing protein n=1 Tax=Aerococcus urinae TaxID=1376 RepID=UPI00254E109F|nr:helix-turn-helix transcriptional regulator [Aerococcus urinae]MDK6688300.1 helix-turn-helix transcriptional regulator [Aerococcus urinae]
MDYTDFKHRLLVAIRTSPYTMLEIKDLIDAPNLSAWLNRDRDNAAGMDTLKANLPLLESILGDFLSPEVYNFNIRVLDVKDSYYHPALKAILKKHDLNYRHLSNMTGISRESITAFGARAPKAWHLVQVIRALDIPPEALTFKWWRDKQEKLIKPRHKKTKKVRYWRFEKVRPETGGWEIKEVVKYE